MDFDRFPGNRAVRRVLDPRDHDLLRLGGGHDDCRGGGAARLLHQVPAAAARHAGRQEPERRAAAARVPGCRPAARPGAPDPRRAHRRRRPRAPAEVSGHGEEAAE